MPPDRIVFVWENFGPYHMDRLNSVAGHFHGSKEIIGIELARKSSTYEWERREADRFHRVTLAKDGTHFFDRSLLWQCLNLMRAALKFRKSDFFFCHYERFAIFICAVILRALRRRVFIMNDMKFADFKRNLLREMIKFVFHAPYCGGIAAGRRSADYFRFMGIPEDRIFIGYGSVSLARLDAACVNCDVPKFEDRPFIIVARFMLMKNLFTVLDAYNLYRQSAPQPRELHFCGSGPLEQDLRDKVRALDLENYVVFRGFLQAEDVTRAIAASLCLILVSTQETFGNVIIEALALGIPVIATPICGATDEFLKSGVNGFLVEADNRTGLANFMLMMDCDETKWNAWSREARAMRSNIDIHNFTNAVEQHVKRAHLNLPSERP